MINTNIMEKKFWDIESDEAFNYRFYYQNENPNNILKRKEKTPSYPFDRWSLFFFSILIFNINFLWK